MKTSARGKFSSIYKRLWSFNFRIDKKGGVGNAGKLFDEYIEIENEALSLFGLSSTSDNQQAIQKHFKLKDREKAEELAYRLLLKLASVQSQTIVDPISFLKQSIANGASADNVLPRIGLTNHTYPIYLYELIKRMPEMIEQIHGEMVLAEKHLDSLGRLESQVEELKKAGLSFVGQFLQKSFPVKREKPAKRGAICMDCRLAETGTSSAPTEKQPFCKHWLPSFWVEQGYQRGWGDAAVGNWPEMEILRRETVEDGDIRVSFIVLAPFILRRPLEIDARYPEGQGSAWGSY